MAAKHDPVSLGSERDVTTPAEEAEALRRERDLLSDLLVTAGVLVVVLDREGRIVRFNRACETTTGYSFEEVSGRAVWDFLLVPEEIGPLRKVLEQLRAGQFPNQHEDHWLTKDGVRRLIAWTHTALLGAGCAVEYVVGTGIDITEQRRATQALVEAYRTLEQRVDDRTHELSTLLEVSKKLASTLELEPLLGSILDELRRVVPYEGCAVYSLEDDELVARAHRGRTPQGTAMSWRWPTRDPLDRLVLTGREPVLVADTRGDSPEAQAYRESVGELQETHYPHIRSWLGVPLIAKGKVIGELALDHSRPGFLTRAHAGFAMAFANQAAVALENARLYAAEQERTKELGALNSISAVVNRSLGLNERMSTALDKTLEAMGLEMGVAYRLEGEPGDPSSGPVLRLMAQRGITEELARRIDPLPLYGTFVEAAAATQQPVVWTVAGYPLVGLRQYMEGAGVQTGVSVPLLSKEKMVGAVILGASAQRRFSPNELSLLSAIGQQVGVAIENARLREQAGQAAALEERGRLARALHDSVTQSLYSVTMYTEAAARLMPPGLEAAAEHLRDARDTAQEALREMRLMIYQLRPPLLEKGGLAVALQVRLDAVERRGGMRAELLVEGEDHLPPAIQAELHQIAQEALNNALKHAHAREVKVHLLLGDATTRLTVRDDGVGFDPAAAAAGGGLGLPGMAERVQRIGGRLELVSAPGRGTQVIVEVPTGGGG